MCVCIRTWETCVSGQTQPCEFDCPSLALTTLLWTNFPAAEGPGKLSAQNKRNIKDLSSQKKKSGQDVDHHANSHVCDGQSCGIGKMIVVIDSTEVNTLLIETWEIICSITQTCYLKKKTVTLYVLISKVMLWQMLCEHLHCHSLCRFLLLTVYIYWQHQNVSRLMWEQEIKLQPGK